MVMAMWSRRVVVLVVSHALVLAGCAAPQGGAPGSSSTENSQASCIVGHVAVGALLGAAVGAATTRKGAGAGAVMGGLAGLGVAWMQCINQYARATTTKVAEMRPGLDPSYSPQQGTSIVVRSAYLDPGVVTPGSKSSVRIAYLVMDPGRDVTVNQSISFVLVMPDGSRHPSATSTDRVVVEPGLNLVQLPIEVPPQIGDARLQATVRLEANGRTAEFQQELLVTSDARLADAGRAEASRQRAEFDRVLAAARTSPTVTTQVVSASTAGQKGELAGARSFVIAIARANIREQASARAKLLGSVARGERLRIDDEVNGPEGQWFKVDAKGIKGWIGASAGRLE